MNHQSEELSELRRVDRNRSRGHGDRLKRALLVLAVPATAAMAVACYGAPMQTQAPPPAQQEENCNDGVDDDGDGLSDSSDPDCSVATKG